MCECKHIMYGLNTTLNFAYLLHSYEAVLQLLTPGQLCTAIGVLFFLQFQHIRHLKNQRV